MDRQIVYPGQILPETSLLQMTKDAMIGSAKLAAAVLGTSAVANGFAVVPTGPASLQVICGAGEIYSLNSIDALAFSSLPADTTHSIMKQGILLDAVTLNCPAPGTNGQSINYLVQATYQDSDSTPVLLPYYNTANPALPYSGMGNNGLTQNTARKGIAVVSVKAGASATTGSQTTPAPDVGYIGLYVVTVAYGQTTITSTNIAQYGSAPLLPSGLLQSVQNGNTSFALDTGTANTYVCAFTPAITTRTEGQVLRFKVKNANTGASTFNDGLGAVALVGAAHVALQGGEMIVNGDAWIQWNSSFGAGAYVLLFCTGGSMQVANATQSQQSVSLGQLQALGSPYAPDTGASNAYAATYSPAITTLVDGAVYRFKAANANTAASTFTPAPGVISPSPIVGGAHSALQGGEIVATGDVWVQWNSSIGAGSWVLIDSTGGGVQVAPATKSQHAAQIGQVGHGQCRLLCNTATSLLLVPKNGNNLMIGGIPYKVPSAGVTVTNSGLNTNTSYYVYAYMSGSTMVMEIVATGHSTDATTGVEIKTGDPSRTLVGAVRTNGSAQFVYSSTSKMVASYFNRVTVSAGISISGAIAFTATTPTNIGSVDLTFWCWGDEATEVKAVAQLTNGSTNQSVTIQSYVDGAIWGKQAGIYITVAATGFCGTSSNSQDPVTGSYLAEGFHTASVYGSVTAGTGSAIQLVHTVLMRA